jgi:hypothetical protein
VENDNPPTKSLTAMGSAPLRRVTLNRDRARVGRVYTDACGPQGAI